jgi:uncharacterized small protein (DUF1192 family)
LSADDDSQAGESEATEGQADHLRRLDNRLDGIYDYVESLEETIANQSAEIQRLREELEQEREARQRAEADLKRDIRDLDDRTDIQRFVERAESANGEQRSMALLQHLKRKALKRQRDGREPIAMMDHAAADEALHYPEVDRTTIYSDMRRVTRWVSDDEMCWYDSGELWLDLSVESSTLPRPDEICGASTTGPTGVSGETTGNQPENQTPR